MSSDKEIVQRAHLSLLADRSPSAEFQGTIMLPKFKVKGVTKIDRPVISELARPRYRRIIRIIMPRLLDEPKYTDSL